MFNNKLFLFTFFLLVREVADSDTPEESCKDWYLKFPTQYKCLEYYKHHRSSGITSTTQTTTTTTTTTTTSTTSTIVITSTWSPGEDFFTTISSPIMSSSSTLQTTTTASVTNAATNKTPWFLSLWALIFYGSVVLSGIIAGGIAYFNKVKRGRIHVNYGRLNRREAEEIEMEPFVSNEELGQDAMNNSSSLVVPPSQETTLNFSNDGYKSASSVDESSDEEFQSLNETVKPTSPAASRTSSPALSSPSGRSTPQGPVSQPSTDPVATPSTATSMVPPAMASSPKPGSPPKLTPTVERIRNRTHPKSLDRSRRKQRASESDPTRIMPRRAAKKKVNYKE